MTTVIINGKTYISTGGSVKVVGNRVIIDGKDATPDAKEIRIEVTGNVEHLSVDVCNSVHVTGSVGKVSTQSGNVACGDVNGSVSSEVGNIDCGDVRGSVSTEVGNIRCKSAGSLKQRF
jgi:hypothetical protein